MLKWFKRKKKSKLPARVKGNACLNCQSVLEGTEIFCPVCGQRNNINPLSFNLVIDEFVGNIFNYDSRVWKTIGPLLLKPGKTAFDFIAGKRKSLVNPFRSYITISLIFFLVYGVLTTLLATNPEQMQLATINNNSSSKKAAAKPLDSLALVKLTDSIIELTKKKVSKPLDSLKLAKLTDSIKNLAKKKVPKPLDSLGLVKFNDSIIKLVKAENDPMDKLTHFKNYYEKNRHLSTSQALEKLGQEPTFWNRFFYEKIQNMYKIEDDGAKTFSDKLFSGLSLTIFLILPLLALVLKLIYVRRKYTYMEHMVFVFYTQSVFFLILLIFTIVFYMVGQNPTVYALSMLLFVIYLFLAMKRFYGQHWFKTFVKFIIANFFFSILATIGFVFLILISFLLY